ncbi:hypothetical protein SLEP1_g37361 [Rubroshorea leprosula]|uniref:Clp R domain-containing protein n=1 Tax=Rubroshorea leprosula TaxID=152421 RepID=A0AAV5KV58_9ROSI|nr:hypothetical protein SLEP1_g37361 [Rubroshorea leprosula]
MPTPVTVAKQSLTLEAANALDEAVGVARRRGHAQTTSLHAVSALLSLSSSPLREACARARNLAYPPRLQFKALELCLSVSLDRVPSSHQVGHEPPVSNSLMAAIKRSQANQRRQPENFHLYRDISQQNPTNISCVKVELQHLILSILDDPVVSRVFGEAGFRSSELKLAIIRPLPNLLRYPRHRGPPVFLCNLENSNADHDRPSGRRSFSFPFPSFGSFFDGEENCRRIGDVLARRRNPLLVGICAQDTLTSFVECVEKRKEGILAEDISGLNVICIDNDVSRCINGDFDKGCLDSKFEEMGRVLQRDLGPGLVVNYGDLKLFLSDNRKNDENDKGGASDPPSYVVAQLTRLLQLHGQRVWLLGAVASYETYMKFVSRFPSTEKDWNLQILPITSLKPSLAESSPRSSLMGSFVPFGGFFSMPPEINGSLSNPYQCTIQCHSFDEKCEQDVLSISKGRSSFPVADRYQSSLPSWLQMTELSTSKGLDVKAKDDGITLNAKVTGLQRKWDTKCQQVHLTHPFPESKTSQLNSEISTVVGFQFIQDKKETADSHSVNNRNAPSNETNCRNINPIMPLNLQNGSFLSKPREKPSRGDNLETVGSVSPSSLCNSCVGDGSQASPASVTSVTTDLGLGLCSVLSSDDSKKKTNQNNIYLGKDFSGCICANVDFITWGISNHPAQSSSSSSHDFGGQFDANEYKMLFRALSERVGWQDEATRLISQTVVNCRTRNEKCDGASQRGDVWFNFIGPDRCGKKKIAIALAEIISGSRDNFIFVDLSSEEGTIQTSSLFNCEEMNHDLRFRGKNVVDYVAGELRKRPLSIVFLENVDEADVLVQSSLSHAIHTGKLSDSHGRDVSTKNAIFVMTSASTTESKVLSNRMEVSNYSEDKILRAKGCPMRILVECMENTNNQNLAEAITAGKGTSNLSFVNKRKLIGTDEVLEQHELKEMTKRANRTSSRKLDLNVSAEEDELRETEDGNVDNDSLCYSKPWLQSFPGQVDKNMVKVVFKPFDFDALAEKLLNQVAESFHKIIGPECLLDIDPKVMDQLLAAAYISDSNTAIEDWVKQVLSSGFAEVQKRYNVTAHSVVKLLICEGLPFEKQTPGVHLPQKIILT